VIATSVQGNALNQDLNGVGKVYNDAHTWGQLGALSDPMQPIAAVPEVESVVGIVGLMLAVFAHQHLKRRRARVQ
jgi:hypothetical protein